MIIHFNLPLAETVLPVVIDAITLIAAHNALNPFIFNQMAYVMVIARLVILKLNKILHTASNVLNIVIFVIIKMNA